MIGKAFFPEHLETKRFSPELVTRAVPYFTKIAEDISKAYKEAERKRKKLDENSGSEALRDKYQDSISTLTRYIDEAQKQGVEVRSIFEDDSLVEPLLVFPVCYKGHKLKFYLPFGSESVSGWDFDGEESFKLHEMKDLENLEAIIETN